MDNEQLWSIYFAGICAMQFHPRNTHNVNTDGLHATLARCEMVANAMLETHRDRWPKDKPQCRGSSEA